MKELVVVGRFTLTRIQTCEGPSKFDVTLKLGEDIIKEYKGCIGKSSATYWGNILLVKAKKMNILYDAKQTNPSETEFIDQWIKLICE